MSMTKKDFIALGNLIRDWNAVEEDYSPKFTEQQISVLAEFCNSQNPNFDRGRWLNYVADKCGPNGGKK